jgi:hypothetical protein
MPITITNTVKMSPDILQFNIISGGGAFTLNPGDERKLNLEFKPKYGGRTSGRIGFEYNGVGSPAVVKLFGTGIGGLVSTNIDSAYAGDKWNLQLSMNNINPEGLKVIATQFSANISFQRTITIPEDLGYILNQSQDTTTISVNGNIPNSNIFASIPMIASLGTVEETALNLSNFKLFDAVGNEVEYDVDYKYGNFKLLGICREGGPRLINPKGTTQFSVIKPNPGSNSIEIDFELRETGKTELFLTNIFGEKVLEIINSELKAGEYQKHINTFNLASGIYIIILQTKSDSQTKRIEILK